MQFRQSISVAAITAFACTAATAADDIAGVRIGSSLEVARAGIAKTNAQFKISPLMLKNGKEGGVTAVTADRMGWTGASNAGGPSDEFAALQNDAGEVWFIARVQRLAEGSRIKEETLLSSVTKKFGAPTDKFGLGFAFNWQFDRNGKQFIGNSSAGPCSSMLRAGSNLPGVTIDVPQSFSPTCGKLITVSASTQPDGMIPHYQIAIVDAKSMFDEIKTRESSAEAQRNQKLQDEKAKSIKPKL